MLNESLAFLRSSFCRKPQNPRRVLTKQLLRKIIGSPLFFIVLSIIYPTVYLLELNSHIYTKDQIFVTFIFVLLLSFAAAITSGVIAFLFTKTILQMAAKLGIRKVDVSLSARLRRAILVGSGTMLLLVFLHTATAGLAPAIRNSIWTVIYIFLSIGMGVLMYRFDLFTFNIILCILMSVNCMAGVVHSIQDKPLTLVHHGMLRNVIFKQRPNVYLVILESFTSLDARNEIYGIDNSVLVQELIDKKYDLHKTFSNYGATLPSMSSILLMDHHYYQTARGVEDGRGYRDLIGGVIYNPVFDVFTSNGYRIDLSNFPAGFYHPSHYTGEVNKHQLLQPLEVLGGFFYFANKLMGFNISESKVYQTVINLPDKIKGQALSEKPKVAQNDNRPVFHLVYPEIGAHIPQVTNWQQLQANNYWLNAYKSSMVKADSALIALIRGLEETDPDAVVILLGDHGPRGNIFRWIGENEDVNENMMENGARPADVTRDFFEVFMAVRWPPPTKKPVLYSSHVNLFRHVFAVLSGDNSILASQVPNHSFMQVAPNNKLFRIKKKECYCVIENGKILDKWVSFTIPSTQ